MRALLPFTLIALQACAVNTASHAPGYSPFTQPPNDTPQFRIDQQACLAEMNQAWSNASLENAALIQFRACLVRKGYLLLG